MKDNSSSSEVCLNITAYLKKIKHAIISWNYLFLTLEPRVFF